VGVSVVAEVVGSASVLAQPAKNSAAAEATASLVIYLVFTCPLSWRNISLSKTLSRSHPKRTRALNLSPIEGDFWLSESNCYLSVTDLESLF